MSRRGKSRDSESVLVAARRWGEGQVERKWVTANAYGVSF